MTKGRFDFFKEDLTDTEVVIAATALIEKSLSFYLTAAFKPSRLSKTSLTEIFSGYGPLASLSARISVCAMLGYIQDDETHDLKIIKDIRNAFAHSPRRMSLEDFPACDRLRLSHPPVNPPGHPRRIAFIRCVAALISAQANSACLLIAQAMVLDARRSEVLQLAEDLRIQAESDRLERRSV